MLGKETVLNGAHLLHTVACKQQTQAGRAEGSAAAHRRTLQGRSSALLVLAFAEIDFV